MTQTDLLGIWNLLSCEGRSTDGRTFHPYGPSPIGRLIYCDSGLMSVHLMSSERERFESDDISKATSAEITKAFESFDSYSGKWVLDPDGELVEHIIDCGRIPNWVGQSHKRYCAIENGKLVLTTEKFEMMGATWQVFVSWERA